MQSTTLTNFRVRTLLGWFRKLDSMLHNFFVLLMYGRGMSFGSVPKLIQVATRPVCKGILDWGTLTAETRQQWNFFYVMALGGLFSLIYITTHYP